MRRSKSELVGLSDEEIDLACNALVVHFARIPFRIRAILGLPTTEEGLREYVKEATIIYTETFRGVVDKTGKE